MIVIFYSLFVILSPSSLFPFLAFSAFFFFIFIFLPFLFFRPLFRLHLSLSPSLPPVLSFSAQFLPLLPHSASLFSLLFLLLRLFFSCSSLAFPPGSSFPLLFLFLCSVTRRPLSLCLVLLFPLLLSFFFFFSFFSFFSSSFDFLTYLLLSLVASSFLIGFSFLLRYFLFLLCLFCLLSFFPFSLRFRSAGFFIWSEVCFL